MNFISHELRNLRIKLNNLKYFLTKKNITFNKLNRHKKVSRNRLNNLISELSRLSLKKSCEKSRGNWVVVYDPVIGGHHTLYTLHYSKLFLDLGINTLIATESPNAIVSASKDYGIDISRAILYKVKPNLPSNYWMTKDGEEVAALEYWVAALNAVLDIRTNRQPLGKVVIFLPWLDSFFPNSDEILNIANVPEVSYAGILFHPIWLRNKNVPKKSILTLKNLNHIAVLDANICDSLSADIGKDIFVLPDFAHKNSVREARNYSSIREIMEKAGGKRIIGLLGSIERRKGVIKFLEMAKSDVTEKYFYICIGKLSEGEFTKDEINFIQSCKKNANFYIETDKFLPTEDEVDEILCRLSCLWLRYENFYHGSNFLTKAAIHGVPVIACNFGYIGELVSSFHLGVLADDSDNSKLLSAVSEALNHGYESSLLRDFLSLNSVERSRPFISKIISSEY